jgi:hypothetical protein
MLVMGFEEVELTEGQLEQVKVVWQEVGSVEGTMDSEAGVGMTVAD